MPLIDISLARGRSEEMLREMINSVTEAVAQSLGAAPESITVIVREVSTDHWARGGDTLTEIRARREAAAK